MAGCSDDNLATEACAAPLDKVLNVFRLGALVIDVLLHLVENNESERQLAVRFALQLEHLLEGIKHFVVADVFHYRVLALERLTDLSSRLAECHPCFEECPRENRRDIQITKFMLEISSAAFDG